MQSESVLHQFTTECIITDAAANIILYHIELPQTNVIRNVVLSASSNKDSKG
jgi:hypothetical protein